MMKRFIISIAFGSMLIMTGSSMGDITVSSTLVQVDGFDSWTISLASDQGKITAFDFLALPSTGEIFNDIDPGGVQTPYDDSVDWGVLGINPALDTHFLTDDLFDHLSDVTDSSDQLAGVSFSEYFSNAAIAQLVVPAGHSIELQIDVVVGEYIYSSRGDELIDLNSNDTVIFSVDPDYKSFCELRAGVGDFNCDFETDLVDLTTLGEFYNRDCCWTLESDFGPLYKHGDTNGDGRIDLIDLTTLGEYYTLDYCQQQAREGDVNCDTVVTLLDAVTVGENYCLAVTPYTMGDANGTGVVDMRDVQIVGGTVSVGPGPEPTPIPVPEPAMLGLITLGSLLTVTRRK